MPLDIAKAVIPIYLDTINAKTVFYPYLSWKPFRDEVLRRDGHECFMCTIWEPDLHVHHIVPVSIDPSRRFDPYNVITLCAECHHEWHAKRVQ
jgi:5-methylcytosine-specific restriction endonuclease McrA